MKDEEKKIKALLVATILANEVLDIVVKEYPEIFRKAVLQTVEKNQDLFKDALEEVKKNNAKM